MKRRQRRIDFPSRLLAITAVLAIAGALPATALAEPQRFRIQVHEDGVYRVDYEQLQTAGLFGPTASANLALTNRGQPIPIRIEDGGDGRFDAGDGLVFVGEHLRGETSHYDDISPFNVYLLSTDAETPSRRMREGNLPGDSTAGGLLPLRVVQHLERDLLRIPLAGQTGAYEKETLWYWKQINHLASQPTRIPVDLGHFEPNGASHISLTVQLRGWSDYASSAFLQVPDHEVTIALNGTPIGSGRWSGRDMHRIEIARIAPELVKTDGNEVEIRVPLRRHGESDDPIIDVVYLDWIEAGFPHDGAIGRQQQGLRVSADQVGDRLRLLDPAAGGEPPAPRLVEVYAREGFRTAALAADHRPDTGTSARVYEASVPAGSQEIWVVPDRDYKHVHHIEIDRPSNLADSNAQRDYFIITHGSLAQEASALAEFHARRGMSTELVDVQDIYDEFNFGIEHPRAIRDFLAHARTTRNAPAPTHVLLVGDASWYVKGHDDGTAESSGFDDRGLIPSWQLRSRDGPAASDNLFVMLEGDDVRPEMAIGRLPAANAAEAHAMVEKTIAYMQNPASGPWRSRLLLASDDSRNLSARNEQLSRVAETAGLETVEFLPTADTSPATHQQRLREHIDEGMLVLHFFGHGGRFMWQTAPASGNAANLFDMEELDRLAPSTRLPIVLSMSCNTGPFDHPAADSLAEKFIRLGDRGAIAVLAASARNSPSVKFTNKVLEGILSGDTLGEAIRAAKDQRLHHDAALLYNLFGDPALIPARSELGGIASDGAGRAP